MAGKFFWPAASAAWMYVIFGFSQQGSGQSSGLSMAVSKKIAAILQQSLLYGRGYDTYNLAETIHPYVRKTAHMTEYAILFILLYMAYGAYLGFCRRISASVWTAAVWASLDEFHQTFIPGRHGCFQDVCVDLTGALAVITVLLFVSGRKEKRLREAALSACSKEAVGNMKRSESGTLNG